MTCTTAPLSFQVPLTTQADKIARQLSSKQQNPQKSRQVYLNALAVYAVNYYCQCLGIEADLNNSDSWHSLNNYLMDVADLEIPGVGKLECRPVLPGAQTVHIPPEVWADRIGYVVVEIDEAAKDANLLGFIPQVTTEELPLSQLQTLTDLLDCWEHEIISEPVAANTQTILERVVNLGQWLQNIFESEWLSPELVLAPAYRSSVRLKTDDLTASHVRVSRVKIIDLGMQVASIGVSLLVQLTSHTDGTVDICLRVFPNGDATYLPLGLQLIALDEYGNFVDQSQARHVDNYIQLELEATQGEAFSIKMALGDSSITENFVI